MKNKVYRILTLVTVGLCHAAPATAGDVREEYLAFMNQPPAEQAAARNAGVRSGVWHCIGPFKDTDFGNLSRSFDFVFPPQEDALAQGGIISNLEKQYNAKYFPGMRSTERQWSAHPEWIDGYANLLPVGPNPSRCESVYLYRVVESERDVELHIQFRYRDMSRVWLNGKEAIRFTDAKSLGVPETLKRFALPLRKGKNHIFVKLTNRYGRHEFAWAVPGLTPFYESAAERDARWERAARTFAGRLPADSVAEFSAWADSFHKDLAQLMDFRFEAVPIPMYAPSRYEIDEVLDRSPLSPGATAYLERLNELRPLVEGALADAVNSRVSAITTVPAAARALDAFGQSEVKRLPPVAFLRRAPIQINAIAPYKSVKTAANASICRYVPAVADGKAEILFHDEDMAILDMNMALDGRGIHFAGNGRIYHLDIAGKKVRQVTHGPGADLSPVELPNGDLVFVSTRKLSYAHCQSVFASLLYKCDAQGNNVTLLSANQDSDHYPQLMNDGSISFTRWDYGIEKGVFERQAIWKLRPDGTSLDLVFGNTILDPNGFWKARAIPGSPAMVCVFGPHHRQQAGMIGLVSNHAGKEAPRGIGYRWVTREVPSVADKPHVYGYQDPWPVNERQFLVAYGGLDTSPASRRVGVWLLDAFGNKYLIYRDPDKRLGCFYPMLLKPRPAPPVMAKQQPETPFVFRPQLEENNDPDDSTFATMYVHDVYKGISKDIPRGKIKSIRIMEQLLKSNVKVNVIWGFSPIVSRGTFHAKRVVGTVPVEDDGSAYFRVPALRNLYLEVLDEDGKMLMQQGSDMHLMPGEVRGCVGCHESREGIHAVPNNASFPAALRKAPVKPTQPEWGTDGLIDFPRVVQPVFDEYCVKCHSGPTPEGQLNLSGGKTRFFNQSYDHLVEKGLVSWHNAHVGPVTENDPMTFGAVASRLTAYLESSEHCGREIPLEERQKVYAWIDANVPYYSTYYYTPKEAEGKRAPRDAWDGRNPKGWFQARLKPVFDRRCMACHKTKNETTSRAGSRWITTSSKIWTDRSLASQGIPRQQLMSIVYGPELRVNLTHPEHSAMLSAPLAKAEGGMGLCRMEDGGSVFQSKQDKDYQRILGAIEEGKRELEANPRIDMQPYTVQAQTTNPLPDPEVALLTRKNKKSGSGGKKKRKK